MPKNHSLNVKTTYINIDIFKSNNKKKYLVIKIMKYNFSSYIDYKVKYLFNNIRPLVTV